MIELTDLGRIMKKGDSGFSVLVATLIFIMLGTISFVGWYVVNSRNNTNSIYDAAPMVSSVKKEAPVKATGTIVSTEDKKVQFNLDTNWVVAARDDTEGACGYEAEGAGSCVLRVEIQPDNFKGKKYSWFIDVYYGQTKMGKDWPGGLIMCKLTNESNQPINGYSAFSAKTTEDSGCTIATFYLVWNSKYIVHFTSSDSNQTSSFAKIVNSIQLSEQLGQIILIIYSVSG